MKFEHEIIAWCLGLGFTLIVIIIALISFLVASGDFQENLAAKKQHKRKMQMMRLKTELAKTGVDPDYINYLEKACDD